jgi:nitrogen fixation NifU-like protein
MFSKELLDHFQSPRNAGELPEAAATVEVSNPVCGDVLRIGVRMDDGKIVEAKFLCKGCTTSIACASRLTELLIGSQTRDLQKIDAKVVASAFGELPAETFHGAHLAADAAQALFAKLKSS